MRRFILLAWLLFAGCTVRPPVIPVQDAGHDIFLPIVGIFDSASAKSAKKGLSTACKDPGYENDFYRVGATWTYTWRSQPALIDGLEVIPMIWDERNVNDDLGGNSDWVMGFNEPDYPGQAMITAEQGAALWRQVESNHPDALLVSPVPSQNDREWLDRFRDTYISIYGVAPRLDALAVHCYSYSADDCIRLLENEIRRASAWGIDQVWLTEYGIFGPAETALIETWKLSIWLEYNPRINRYAWFTNRVGCDNVEDIWDSIDLFNTDGKMTITGKAYAHFPDLIWPVRLDLAEPAPNPYP